MPTQVTHGRNPRSQRQDSPSNADIGKSSTIRVLVAADQALDRKGLIALLETQDDFQIVGESSSGLEAVELSKAATPDVLILDTRLHDPGGVATIPNIRSASASTKILALASRGESSCLVLNPPRFGKPWKHAADPTCSPNNDCLQLAVVAGAHGALRRSATPDELFRAVRAVASGHAWYEAGTATRLLDRALRRTPEHELSPREAEVAGLIAEGYCNKDIARALGITAPTVKKHVGRILSKLGLDDRLQVGLHLARNPLLLHRVGT